MKKCLKCNVLYENKISVCSKCNISLVRLCPKCNEEYEAWADTCPKCNIDLESGNKVELNRDIDLEKLKKEYKNLMLCFKLYLLIILFFILGLFTNSFFGFAILLLCPLNILLYFRTVKLNKIMGASILVSSFFTVLLPFPMLINSYREAKEILKKAA